MVYSEKFIEETIKALAKCNLECNFVMYPQDPSIIIWYKINDGSEFAWIHLVDESETPQQIAEMAVENYRVYQREKRVDAQLNEIGIETISAPARWGIPCKHCDYTYDVEDAGFPHYFCPYCGHENVIGDDDDETSYGQI